jgi:ABC-type taurine transport system substrate-binding protein
MTDKDLRPDARAVSALDIAEIETLMLVKEVGADRLQLVLDGKGVQKLEDLDGLTIRNFLHYLRSL